MNLASADCPESQHGPNFVLWRIDVAFEVQGPSWCLSTPLLTLVYFILFDFSEAHGGNQRVKASLSRDPYVSVGYYFDSQKLNAESRVKRSAGNVLNKSHLSSCNTVEAQHKDLKIFWAQIEQFSLNGA